MFHDYRATFLKADIAEQAKPKALVITDRMLLVADVDSYVIDRLDT